MWAKMLSCRFFSVNVLLTAIVSISAVSSDECVYTLYVETGSVIKGGTDSKISITLSDYKGNSVWVPNVKDWGLMGRKHDYFERGNLDIFTGLGPYIGAPICRLNVTSNGHGAHPGWFCNFVEVTSSGPHKGCSQSIFYVDQWLASDAPPFQLSAILDGCYLWAKSNGGPLIVRRPVGFPRQ